MKITAFLMTQKCNSQKKWSGERRVKKRHPRFFFEVFGAERHRLSDHRASSASAASISRREHENRGGRSRAKTCSHSSLWACRHLQDADVGRPTRRSDEHDGTPALEL